MRTKRFIGALIGAVTLATGLLTGATPAAAKPVGPSLSAAAQAEIASGNAVYIDAATLAATGCGSACDGKNPYSFKVYYSGSSYRYCYDDRRTVEYQNPAAGFPKLELLASAACRTAWTRLTPAGATVPRIESYTTSGALRTSYHGFVQSNWTQMVNGAGYGQKACMSQGSTAACTFKYFM
ncbi:Protein of unknown function [Asanoa hainanensis]|uniref:Peptidase inhibitor family I36 n=1 Tax=Asanoa hainanensis TaxID=560556 RepID=A0A239NBS3_9ACTN|nr:DUF2690 domain-containing protein [Asanoa hainanensis]SNT51629.1 Protein of unknown function [Asanoa hainanensis]